MSLEILQVISCNYANDSIGWSVFSVYYRAGRCAYWSGALGVLIKWKSRFAGATDGFQVVEIQKSVGFLFLEWK